MNTKILMTVASLVVGLIGLVIIFAPQEVVAAFGLPITNSLPVLIQLTGALYLSFAFINWTARDSVIGGVYARPISIGNFAHFFVGTLVLVREQIVREIRMPLVALLAGYAVFAIVFGWLVFGHTGLRKDESKV